MSVWWHVVYCKTLFLNILNIEKFNTATSSKYNNLTAYGSVYYSILVAYVKDQFHECVKKKPKDRDKFLIILKSWKKFNSLSKPDQIKWDFF